MNSSKTLILNNLLKKALEKKASVLLFVVGIQPIMKVEGECLLVKEEDITSQEFSRDIIQSILTIEEQEIFERERNITIIKEIVKDYRFRVNIYYQKGVPTISFQTINNEYPPLDKLRINKQFKDLVNKNNGIMIISGPYASGKTTTLLSFISEINNKKNKHIIILEELTENILSSNNSIVEQIEIGKDSKSLQDSLDALNYRTYDVLIVSKNIRDKNELKEILNISSSGKLVIIMCHTSSVEGTLDQFLSFFSNENEKKYMQAVLSRELLGIVNQRLIKKIGGGRTLATEVLINNKTSRATIEEGNVAQIRNVIKIGESEGMHTLDQNLKELVKNSEILPEVAIDFAHNANKFSNTQDENIIKW